MPPSNKEIEDIVSYSWNIDTKYYTAEIKLCTTKKRTVGTEEFADGVEAIVIYFNASQVSLHHMSLKGERERENYFMIRNIKYKDTFTLLCFILIGREL